MSPGETTAEATPQNEEPKRSGLAPAWQKGQSGNPRGRPKGSRNKLGEDFVSALQADFAEHGIDAIAKVRTSKPSDYLKVIASLVPQQIEFRQAREELTDDELDRLIAALEGAKSAPIEVVTVEALPGPQSGPPEPVVSPPDVLAPASLDACQGAPVASLDHEGASVAVGSATGTVAVTNEAKAELAPTPHMGDAERAGAQGGPVPQPPGQKSS